jgi:hypothetical protein
LSITHRPIYLESFHNSTPSVSVNDVDSITHIAETYSKQPQYLRAYILI